jgi:exodeoxyribonuclease-5
MQLNEFAKTIKKNFKHTPTSDQELLIEKLSEFILSRKTSEAFILKGYAGTGKTTLMSALVKSLPAIKVKSILLAPTGRAAKVLGQYTEKPAFTIHKKIYKQQSSSDGFGKFVLSNNLYKDTLFIVDEASMISNQSTEGSVFGSGRLLDDLVYYIYQVPSCKLLLIGDTAQLPPVHLSISPALEYREVAKYGLDVFEIELKQVVRQAKESGILKNATYLREILPDYKDTEYPFFDIENFVDVKKISGNELIEQIASCYDKDGLEQTMVVTRSNMRANRYNEGIRRTILWREEEIAVGDMLMVVKNNYFWAENVDSMDFIANGDIAEITRIIKYEEQYGYRFARVELNFSDYANAEFEAIIFLSTLFLGAASLSYEQSTAFYRKIEEDYSTEKTKSARYKKIKENQYFNALQVKFAYAVTCHKAQGGQWKNIFIDQGYLVKDMLNKDFLRWLYTAVTRATENLYLVNFNKEFFEQKN